MTSNHHALYDLGYTRTTMAFNKEKQSREGPKADPYDPSTVWTSGHYAYTGRWAKNNSAFNRVSTAYLRLKSIELGLSLIHISL